MDVNRVPEKPLPRNVIEACSVFNSLGEEQRIELARNGHIAYAERGEAIWLAGSPSHFIAVVGVGFIKMTRLTPQGSEVSIELLGPGQCLGLLAAIEGREYPLNAIAVTNAWYLKVSTRVCVETYNQSPSLRDHILRAIGPRLRRAHEMMARMSSGKIEQRLAAVLMILMDSYGETHGTSTQITVPLTRQDLGEMAGTTVETSIRILSAWQKRGILRTDRQLVTILKPECLTEILSIH